MIGEALLADVRGSLEAIVSALNEIGNDDMAAAGVNVRVAWNSASNLYQ